MAARTAAMTDLNAVELSAAQLVGMWDLQMGISSVVA